MIDLITKKCEICGKEFQINPNHKSNKKRFCGHSCSFKYKWSKGVYSNINKDKKHCKKCGGFLSTKKKHKCIVITPPTPELTARRIATLKEGYRSGRIKPTRYWLNKKRYKETITKMSVTMKKKHKNPKFVAKMVFVKGHKQYNTGRTHFKDGENSKENHHNWKGGITPFRKKRWCSKQYQKWRQKIFTRDNYTCQIINCRFCKNSKGGEIQAHHINLISENLDLIYNVNNGITLCQKSHMLYHKERRLKNKDKFKHIIINNNKFFWREKNENI